MKIIMAYYQAYPFHFAYGGTQKYTYYLCKHLVKKGIDIEIVTSCIGDDRMRREVYEGMHYTLIPPNIRRGANNTRRRVPAFWNLLYCINVARYLRRKSFDIMHGFEFVPYAYLHLKNRAPVIYQPFGNEGILDSRIQKMTVLRRIYETMLVTPVWRYCGNKSDLVLAEGEFQVAELIDLYHIDREKIDILPVGIDMASIREKCLAKKMTRSEIGLNNDDFVLITSNTIIKTKGINYLIDAFYLLRHGKYNIENIKLIIIGIGAEEDAIKKQIHEYNLADGIIHLRNVQEEQLYPIFSLADLYVSPVLQRDFITGILESSALGLPIVSTGQEWIVKNGLNGYVVPPGNPGAMAEAIVKVYTGDAKQMGCESMIIAKEYDFGCIADKAIAIYEDIISKNYSSLT